MMRSESLDAIDHGLRRLLQITELVCTRDLQLFPCELPAELSRIDGSLNGMPLMLSTRRYQGEAFASFTVAVLELAERLCSFTVVGLPPAGAPWPVLGIDIIALRGSISLVALDLSPTDRDYWEIHCAPVLTAIHERTRDVCIPRKTPAFTAGVFSPQALIAAAQVGHEQSIFAATESVLQQLPRITKPCSESAFTNAAHARRDDWLVAEKQNRKEHNALERMFGAAMSSRYLNEVLLATPDRECWA